MTALGGRDVKRTFSAVAEICTGLPCPKTHEGRSEQIGQFGNTSDVGFDGAAHGGF